MSNKTKSTTSTKSTNQGYIFMPYIPITKPVIITSTTWSTELEENMNYLNSQLNSLTPKEYKMWYNSVFVYEKDFINIFKNFIRNKKLSKIINKTCQV